MSNSVSKRFWPCQINTARGNSVNNVWNKRKKDKVFEGWQNIGLGTFAISKKVSTKSIDHLF